MVNFSLSLSLSFLLFFLRLFCHERARREHALMLHDKAFVVFLSSLLFVFFFFFFFFFFFLGIIENDGIVTFV